MSRKRAHTTRNTSYTENVSESSLYHAPYASDQAITDHQVSIYPLRSDVTYEAIQDHPTTNYSLNSLVNEEDYEENPDQTEATNQDQLAQQPKKPVELLIERKNKPSLKRMKMDELVRALRIRPGDEIKYENDHGINCQIIYQNVHSPTALEDYIFVHCGIHDNVDSSKGRYAVWDRCSITRNGIHIGTFREIRTQLVKDYSDNTKSLQDALKTTAKKRGPVSYQHLKNRVDDLEHAAMNQRDAAIDERDAANTVSRRLFSLFGEMHKTWTEEGQAFTDAQLLQFKSIADSAPQLWGDMLQEEETDHGDNNHTIGDPNTTDDGYMADDADMVDY